MHGLPLRPVYVHPVVWFLELGGHPGGDKCPPPRPVLLCPHGLLRKRHLFTPHGNQEVHQQLRIGCRNKDGKRGGEGNGCVDQRVTGIGVLNLGLRFKIQGLRFEFQDMSFKVEDSRFRIQVSKSRFKV